ncbi:hypothetical protein RCZ04_02400 [Capnocytophaga sp. HP1101]
MLLGSIAMLQAQVKTGLEVKIGGNIAGLYYSDSSNSDRTFTPGFHTGGLFSLNFPSGIALETGLMLNTKGQAYEYKYKDDDKRQLSELHYTYGYLEVPFYVGYKLKLGNVKLVWKAGPYVAAALWGNSREEWAYYKDNRLKDYKETNRHSLSIGNSSSDDLRPFDAGLNLATGVEIKRFTAGLQYGIGFSDVLPNRSESTSNQVLSLSVGYRIF